MTAQVFKNNFKKNNKKQLYFIKINKYDEHMI